MWLCTTVHAYVWNGAGQHWPYESDAPYFFPYTCAMWGDSDGVQVKVTNMYAVADCNYKVQHYYTKYCLNMELPATLDFIPFGDDYVAWETAPTLAENGYNKNNETFNVLSLAKIEPRPYEEVKNRCEGLLFYGSDDTNVLWPSPKFRDPSDGRYDLEQYKNLEYEIHWGFESLKLPDGLIHIGDSACVKVIVIDTPLEIPSTIEYIGDLAFSCGDFDVEISGATALTHVGVKAMYGMSTKEIILPKSVKEVGELAFGPALSTQRVLNYTGCSCLPYKFINGAIGYDFEETYREYTRDVSYQTKLCLERLVSMNPEPPSVIREYKRDEATGQMTDELMRDEPILSHEEFASQIPLYVPDGAVDAYRQAPGWKNFTQIYPLSELSGIDDINIDGQLFEVGRYDLNGRLVDDNYRGIVVVKYSDGSVRKELR